MEIVFGKLLFFFLVFIRLSAFFLIIPILGARVIPVRIKLSLAILISLFFAVTTPISIEMNNRTFLEAVVLLSIEATYGFVLGLIIIMMFSVVKIAGRIIERQMGMAMAQVMDPFTGDKSQPIGTLLEIIFMLLFLAADGHHLILMVISRSYEIFPPGVIPTVGEMTSSVVQAGSMMLTAALRLSAPILVAFIVLMVVLGIMARIVPDMNILFISLPLKVGLGMAMLIVFIPFIDSFVNEFADWMEKLLPL